MFDDKTKKMHHSILHFCTEETNFSGIRFECLKAPQPNKEKTWVVNGDFNHHISCIFYLWSNICVFGLKTRTGPTANTFLFNLIMFEVDQAKTVIRIEFLVFQSIQFDPRFHTNWILFISQSIIRLLHTSLGITSSKQ